MKEAHTHDRPETSRPAGLRALIAAMAFQGLSGIAGGYGLVSDRSGGALGIPQVWLQGSPFDDYLVPGVVLFTVLGVVPLVVTYGLWTERDWAWAASLLTGLALLVWIGVETLIIGYHSEPPLQLVYGVLGLAMVGLALLPSVRRHCARAERLGTSPPVRPSRR